MSVLSAQALFAKAVSRRRERCATLTAYTHANLASYLQPLLPPGWRVEVPAPGQQGISSFPVASEAPDEHAKELEHLSAYLGIPIAEAEDQYHGHCETCAVRFTETVLATLTASPASVLPTAYADLTSSLSQLSWQGQAEAVFAAERRAREDATREPLQRIGRMAAMWAPLVPHSALASDFAQSESGEGASAGGGAAAAAIATAMGTVAASSLEFLAGSPSFPARLSAALARSTAAEGAGSAAIPCYILSALDASITCVGPRTITPHCSLFFFLLPPFTMTRLHLGW